MNRICITGRLTTPPMIETPNGRTLCKFNVISSRKANRKKTDTVQIVTWAGLAETCAKYLMKGQLVSLSGEMHINVYKDDKGITKYSTSVEADYVEFLTKPANASEDREDDGGYFDDTTFMD